MSVSHSEQNDPQVDLRLIEAINDDDEVTLSNFYLFCCDIFIICNLMMNQIYVTLGS